jgi:hypothetical protein
MRCLIKPHYSNGWLRKAVNLRVQNMTKKTYFHYQIKTTIPLNYQCMSYQCKTCYSDLISLLKMSTSLHIKFAAFAHLEEGEIERRAENRVKSRVLRYETLHLLSITEG